MSANTNVGRKETNEMQGLHTSNDPDPKHLSYSNTFMNYKQHVMKDQSMTMVNNLNNAKQNLLPPGSHHSNNGLTA